MATLITDLKDRGLLENTLIVWMGEFGRSPVDGKGHYARAWTTMLAGGGLKSGQVIGKTDEKAKKPGGTVVERPVSTADFFATICRALEINPAKEFHAAGDRPMPIVANGAEPIRELLSERRVRSGTDKPSLLAGEVSPTFRSRPPHPTIASASQPDFPGKDSMSQRKQYDCIVIGGGHNGLVTAAYLAKAGKSVCVLERRHVLGGCASTEELWPGYKVSTAAYVISLLLPEIIRDLRLKHYGLEILPRNPSSFTPMLDGRSLLLGPDKRHNYQEISKFSERDAEAFPRYEALLERVADAIEPVLAKAAPDPFPLPKARRKIGLGKRMRDTAKLWEMYQAMQELGEDLPAAIELLTGAARPVLERWFEAEVLKTTLATDAIIGAFASISSPGTAYVLLHHVMGEAGGARGIWGYVRGGMGGLAESLERACHDLQVEIRREAEVSKIFTSQGKIQAVALADGTVLEAPVVASSVDAHLTFEKFLDPAVLPDDFRRDVANIDYSSASAKVNVALSEPPQFDCLPGVGIAPHHHGTIHIGETLNTLERAYDDAKYGRPSREPILEITLPSSLDDTISPAGKHVMSMFVQFADRKSVV